MRPRLIRLSRRDDGTGPDARLARIASCHEAGHAIAAYHLQFPYRIVRFREPRNGRIDETDLQPDNVAFQIGLRFLEGVGSSHSRALIAFCTVMSIARHVNLHINHVPAPEAEGYAGSDIRQMNEFFANQGYTPPQQHAVTAQADAESQRIIALDGFREALEAVAARLLSDGELDSWEVEQIVHSAVGDRLKWNCREPQHSEVARAAYYLHRTHLGADGDQFRDWLVAEKGIRFGIASRV